MSLLILVITRRRSRLAATLAVLLLTGCAHGPKTSDPFEATNRRVFAFNERVDASVLAPIARGYRRLVPGPVRRGVSNVFANLRDLGGFVNAGLQGNLPGAASNGGRVAINSTVGVFGLFDVASRVGLEGYRTDFGHTLASWGVDRGPYLVLPLLGPATARSGAGTLVDLGMQQQWPLPGGLGITAAEAVDTRAALLAADAMVTGDRYLFVREAYLQYRAGLVGEAPASDGFVEDDGSYDWGD